MLELEDSVEINTGNLELPSPAEIAISKSGKREVVQIDDITAMKWDSPKLTLLVVGTVLMDFKDGDARRAFDSLLKVGIPLDPSLGKVRW